MHVDDEFSKFTSSLNKFINKQWSKVRISTSSLKSAKNLDQVLEQEYETLLREIDYLTAEKSCYLSFKNDHFTNTKSSEDLTKILTKHSEEVLKTYITQHDKAVKKDTLDNRNDLINYVTEIIVSRPKCNNKVCTCKPVKSTKEVFTDSIVPKENGKGTQTGGGKSTGKPASTQISNNAIVKKVNIEVQTDDWNHDRNCTCGCCPKSEFQVTTKNVSTEEKQLKDATTSDKKITSSKSVLADCVGNTVEAHTSTIKLCVPENFETLLSNGASNKFSTCTRKRDCACDAYDVKEAIKRGLVLPCSEICIQPKKVNFNEKEKSTQNDKKYETSSEISSLDESASKKEKKKTKEKEKIKNKEKKKKEESDSSSSSTPREKPKKKKAGTTGCFGSKNKNRECNEYCQGIVKRQRSMQTMPIRTNDKSEEAYESSENDRKTIETSTKSEKGIQLNSKVDLTKEDNHDKEVSLKENKETGRSRVFIGNNKSKSEKDTDTREQDNQEKSKEGMICNKCGRQKRDCNSGCRNTFIIPYASGSNGAIPPGDAESLRMLIKMHSKDTSRQFDNVMAELNHQKSEIKRLNDMYLKMLTSFSDSQKLVGSSKSNSNYYSNKSRESSKPCGCSFSNECKISNKHNTPTEKSNNSNNACACSFNSNNTSNGPVRRFGPPNTAVAINMCDTCTVEIGGSSNVRNGSCLRDCEYFDGDNHKEMEVLNIIAFLQEY